MAQAGVQLDQEKFCCSICLDLLKDPATVPCGHSYCMKCINQHWDGEDQKKTHSCPQCRQTFTPRPVLVKNTMLADLVEDLKKAGAQAEPHDHSSAAPGGVACDFCTGQKLKAVKSCLQCLASYCEKHLQPHHEDPSFQKHTLVSAEPQENICSRHSKAREIFCRTDQLCICYLCFVDEHKGHDTVSAAAERTERQRELEASRQRIQHRIQDREKKLKLLQQEVEDINHSAETVLVEGEKIITELIRLLEKRVSEVKQQITDEQETEVSRVQELQEKLQQEMAELRRKDEELEQLSLTEDHRQFLQRYPLGSPPRVLADPPSISTRPRTFFEGVTAAVSELRDRLRDALSPRQAEEADLSLSLEEPTTRADFLKYSCQITLDPNTVNRKLLISEGNRKVKCLSSLMKPPSSPPHPQRFTDCPQVLSQQLLTGRCYWQVKWSGSVLVTVSYSSISRTGPQSLFGNNDQSWTLYCDKGCYRFRHNGIIAPLHGPRSSKVGVYLDHSAGALSFYSVSETMTLLHRVQTTFTQPLLAGLGIGFGSAEVCELQKN